MNVPEPRSVSPALWEHREAVLTWLENEQDWWRGFVIAVPLTFEVMVSVYDPTRPPKIDPRPWYREVRLDVKRAAAPAPWTGSPFMYTWAVAEGPPGYWAATDAKAVFPYGLETDLWPR